MFVCIIDSDGNILFHKNMGANPTHLLPFIQPYKDDIIIGVECLFTRHRPNSCSCNPLWNTGYAAISRCWEFQLLFPPPCEMFAWIRWETGQRRTQKNRKLSSQMGIQRMLASSSFAIIRLEKSYSKDLSVEMGKQKSCPWLHRNSVEPYFMFVIAWNPGKNRGSQDTVPRRPAQVTTGWLPADLLFWIRRLSGTE